ncbi:flagellar calcium-binding protein [Nitzschia inconspicua]|uniref:Flagellar calcium-binding protein n=1 Tax=Nitzschia inconspicua TaxID=303405 RepID=A0A9K3Q1K3_9STRA|nr:flagellar calcium-binding protein [Nitzschia inconspicua]
MAIGPTINPEDVGVTGLLWLFLSYGYALFYSANLIGEGSELLLLVPSMAGLVGGVVLPLLGAVPDGAIILFSGLGSIEVAQESLSVGIGALAGSTIMLLTVPWGLSVFAGRVDIQDGSKPNYTKRPKLTEDSGWEHTLFHTGVAITDEIRHGGVIMAITTLPYFLIQVPASFLHGPTEEIAVGEHWWALGGFIVCLIGLVWYMHLQLTFSKEGQDKHKRIAIAKKTLQEGKMSLKGVLKSTIEDYQRQNPGNSVDGEYSSLTQDDNSYEPPPPEIADILKEILWDAFQAYDKDLNGKLEQHEIRAFLKDFHENISDEEILAVKRRVDANNDDYVSFDEFVTMAYHLILSSHNREQSGNVRQNSARELVSDSVFSDGDDGEEEEEIPEDFTDLSPEEQQKAIKWRAFKMLSIGTAMVVYFSDPMVDVMQEIAVRAKISPFYVSFVLAPLASNASEVVASMFYAAKKTRKTMTVSLSALEGAACMNNTFCLSIFMALIFFRGLAWQYSAETISIVLVELMMAVMVRSPVMTAGRALFVLSIFPLSLVLVAGLEYIGFD